LADDRVVVVVVVVVAAAAVLVVHVLFGKVLLQDAEIERLVAAVANVAVVRDIVLVVVAK
jgi:hypothetical protein